MSSAVWVELFHVYLKYTFYNVHILNTMIRHGSQYAAKTWDKYNMDIVQIWVTFISNHFSSFL